MAELIKNHRLAKTNDMKEQQILAILQRPGMHEKITSIAATLAETFSVQTKLLVDIRPMAVFIDTQTKQQYVYEATLPPFDVDPVTTLIMREARQPVEELTDQGYVSFRENSINGNRYILPLKDFIKFFAVEKWQITDLNISDERERTKNLVL